MRIQFPVLFLLLSVLPFSLSAKTKIDTIDFWHVYYNHKIIGQFNQVSEDPVIIIKKAKIQPNDILSIEYGNDAPGDDIIGVYVKDGLLKKIKLAQGKANFSFTNRLNIPVAKILDISKRLNRKTLDFYYYNLPRRDQFIFRLKLE